MQIRSRNGKKRRQRVWLLTVLICLAAALTGCTVARLEKGSSQKEYSAQRFAMGTLFTAKVYTAEDGEQTLTDALDQVTRAEELLSWRKEGSVPSQFNQQGEADASPLGSLLPTVLDVCRKSGGALDITVLPLSRLWNFDRMEEADFDRSQMSVPDAARIRESLEKVGFGKLSYNEETGLLQSSGTDVQLELGAAGKGYAIDQALEAARKEGAAGVLVSAGSSIGMAGSKPDGSLFKVALRDPRGSLDDSIGTLTLSDCCISTSGDYERYFEKDGIRYHHILDPHTGYPADSGLMQVTVICDSGALGDCLSTACFVLGLERGMLLAKEYNVLAFFVDKEKNIWYNNADILGFLDFYGERAGYTISRYPE